jgi:sec-independent protein translocase protein TatB
VFGITFDKILVIAVIAVIIIGPQRLPEYAAKLAQFIKSLKSMADAAKARVTDELGPEAADVDWHKLDPRQYDPRRIIRTALLDDEPVPVVSRVAPQERGPRPPLRDEQVAEEGAREL